MNDPNIFDRWGDQLPNVGPVRGYDDTIDTQDGYDRYGHPGYHEERYEDERCDETNPIERIDSYGNLNRPVTYQGGRNGFEGFRQEHTVDSRNYYGVEGSVAQEDGPYESAALDYQSGRYLYEEDTLDDRGTVNDTVYERGMAPTKFYDRGDRGTVGGTVYDNGTVDDTALYGRGAVYDRDMVTRGYERDAVAVGEYDEVSAVGAEYDKGTIDGGGYDRGIIIDPEVDRGAVRGAEYDRLVYEPKVRKSSAEYIRGYGNGPDSDNVMYDTAAMASSRRLNRRRQMASPIPSQTAIHARISEDSPPLTSRSSERMKMIRSTSITNLSHNNGRIKKHHSRESEQKIPPQHKQRGRKNNHEKAPQVRRETKEYTKPIEVLEFRPEPFPEADNDTFCLRDAPVYATKQKKKSRPRKPQVSESSSSDDSESSRDSQSSSRSGSSSGSSRTDLESVDSRKKSKGKRNSKHAKGHSHHKKHSKSSRGNYSDSESDEEAGAGTGAGTGAVGTFLNFLGGGTKEATKVVGARRSRRKK